MPAGDAPFAGAGEVGAGALADGAGVRGAKIAVVGVWRGISVGRGGTG